MNWIVGDIRIFQITKSYARVNYVATVFIPLNHEFENTREERRRARSLFSLRNTFLSTVYLRFLASLRISSTSVPFYCMFITVVSTILGGFGLQAIISLCTRFSLCNFCFIVLGGSIAIPESQEVEKTLFTEVRVSIASHWVRRQRK